MIRSASGVGLLLFCMAKWSTSAKVAWSIWAVATFLIGVLWAFIDVGFNDPHGRSQEEIFRTYGPQALFGGFLTVGFFMAPVALVVYGVGRLWSRARGSKSVTVPPAAPPR